MTVQTRITLGQVAEYFHIDFEIVRDFAEFGLYPSVYADGEFAVETHNIDKVKKIISLHKALGVNKEGIEIILKLGDRISALQSAIDELEHRVQKLNQHRGVAEIEVLKNMGLLIEIDE